MKASAIKRSVGFLVLASFISTFVLPSVATARKLQPSGLSETGFIKITTLHSGVAVRIDEKFVGLTPLEIQEVAAGEHSIEASHPDQHQWLQRDFNAVVDVVPGDTALVVVLFEQNYSINSTPYGATVTDDGKVVGQTPLYIQVKEMTSRPIVLSQHGFLDSTIVLGINSDRFFNIKLKREQAHGLVLPSSAFKVKKKRRPRTPFLATLGLSLVAGSLALFFRNKADNRYNRYLKTGEPRALSNLYSDAKRFDKFAAASFGVFQASLGASFVLFLKGTSQK